MKFTALAVTAIVTVASVASANEYQPALRALAASEPAAPDAVTFAADPTNKQSLPVEGAGATRKEFTDDENVDSKKSQEWWGRSNWGRPWGGFGWGRPWGGYGGGWGGGYGGGWGW